MVNFKLPSLHAKIDMNADVDASKRRWSPSFFDENFTGFYLNFNADSEDSGGLEQFFGV